MSYRRLDYRDIYKKYFKCGGNSYKSKIDKGVGNPPMTFFDTIPLYLPMQGCKIECSNQDFGYYTIDVPLFNNTVKNSVEFVVGKNKSETLMVNSRHIKFGFNVKRDKQLEQIITHIMDGTYEYGDSKLQRVNSKKKGHKYEYYFLLSYSKPKVEHEELDPNKVMGVDIGVKVPAYCAVNYNDYMRREIGDSSIHRQCLRDKKAYENMQKSITYNLKDGHGRKHKLDGYNGMNNKSANRNSTYNSVIASHVVKAAIQWQCGTIHIEDLSGITERDKDNVFLRNWTYYDLQQKIENKANENGITVKKVNRYGTSQTCSVCGTRDKLNRPKGEKGQAYFKCQNCGYEANADYNAARNIAMSDKFVK